MEITQIRYFLDVAETEHMTQSADRLHIAQPALSRSIKNLEEELGVPLFVSRGRNIVLSEYGRFLQAKLSPMISELDRLPELLGTMAKLRSETVHLNVLAASSLITEAIIEYKAKHKDLNFQLLQNTQSDVFDIEITTEICHGDTADNEYVCHEKIFLAVPNNGRYRGRKTVSLRDAEDEGFISLMGSLQFRYICDSFCRKAGFRPELIFESDNPAAVKNMIAANMGVGFWPEFTWGHIESDNVLLLEIEDLPLSRDLVIRHNRNKSDNTNVEKFFEFLKDFCERKRGY
ncbi:MAG: LysR family transcriptional regulator [Clostridia bacterium]|nr:LysR family transcriptional regulator [Clostridia bacterium]